MNKKFIFSLIAIGISFIFTFLLVEVFVRVYESQMTKTETTNLKSMYKYDNKLGWSLVDGVYNQKHQDFDANYTVINETRKTVTSDRGTKIVNFYGDSFCFGTGMGDKDTVASLYATFIGSDTIVNNFGVSGYGPLQYKLKYDKTKSSYLNIFLIYTGNDYMDIQRNQIEWGPYKPYLVKDASGYSVSYPPNKFNVKMEQSEPSFFEIRSIKFIKRLLKSIPFVVNIRNQFVKPNQDFVNESLNRFEYIYTNIDKQTTLFVVVPSISLVSGISTNTDEGLFRKKLLDYLNEKSYKYIDLLSLDKITKEDFWPHEGHNNIQGNEKIAKILSEKIKESE